MRYDIHYRGGLRDAGLLPAITEELVQLSERLSWNCFLLRHPVFEGAVLGPSGSELLTMTFSADGILQPALRLLQGLPGEAFISRYTFSQDDHAAATRLLRYLGDKYFDEFELFAGQSHPFPLMRGMRA